MIDRALPVQPGQGGALRLRNRHHRDGGKCLVQGHQVWDVKSTVQRSHVWSVQLHGQWIMQIVDVKMDQIKGMCLMFLLKYLLQQYHVRCELIDTLVVQPQCVRPGGDQVRLSDRVAAGEQGHLMALTEEFLGEVGDNPLGTTVVFRRHTFIEWSYLSDFHSTLPSIDTSARWNTSSNGGSTACAYKRQQP